MAFHQILYKEIDGKWLNAILQLLIPMISLLECILGGFTMPHQYIQLLLLIYQGTIGI